MGKQIVEYTNSEKIFSHKKNEVLEAGVMSQWAKPLPVMLAFHLGYGSSPDAVLLIQFPASASGKIVGDGQVFGSFSPMWESRMEFLALGFGLAQPLSLYPLGD